MVRIPDRGPLIIISNHINFLEVPILVSHTFPKPILGIAKEETWKNPLLGPLFKLWEMIPIKRGEVDLTAMHKAMQALEFGENHRHCSRRYPQQIRSAPDGPPGYAAAGSEKSGTANASGALWW